jgi:chemotaxis family two-component system response regulator Rcp1
MKEAGAVVRVLVVEDNPMDVRLLRHTLGRDPGWKTDVVVAGDGEEAMASLLATGVAKPDLVILDLNLPKRDGTEVLQLIRGTLAASGLPVIVFSSSPEDVMRDRLREANVTADCYVTKPIEVELFFNLSQRFRRCYEKSLRVRERDQLRRTAGGGEQDWNR